MSFLYYELSLFFADVEGEETVSVMLNGEESELTFFKINNTKVGNESFNLVD